jgi:NAD-dependent SIR2 family protein deacetylase
MCAALSVDVKAARELLRSCKKLTVLTGAGVSAESGALRP